MSNNILVVDDAAFMRMMIKDILTKNGYNVVGEAENGQEAVEKFAELNPDLVTMDITMPEMDGITALKKIKETSPDAKILMCSAMGQQAMVIDAIQAGAKDFIVKPFQADRVIEAIQKAMFDDKAHEYQSYQGLPELRKGMADFYQNHFNVGLDFNTEILPLMGSKEGIMHISMAFLNEGDEVLIPNPGYPTYAAVTELVQAKPVWLFWHQV